MSNYKTLDTWKNSMQLVKEIYILTKGYPKEELFALTSQTKRAAVSVSAKNAEGIGRQYKKDTLNFLHISRGSLYELETLINVALLVEIIDDERFRNINSLVEKNLQILNGFINYYQKSNLK